MSAPVDSGKKSRPTPTIRSVSAIIWLSAIHRAVLATVTAKSFISMPWNWLIFTLMNSSKPRTFSPLFKMLMTLFSSRRRLR